MTQALGEKYIFGVRIVNFTAVKEGVSLRAVELGSTEICHVVALSQKGPLSVSPVDSKPWPAT